MSLTLYTPATGFPDLEAKIAYGLARVGIEAYGAEKVVIRDIGGFYEIIVDGEINKIEECFNFICKRLLSSEFIPMITPGIKKSGKKGGFVGNITFKKNEKFSLEVFKRTLTIFRENVKDEPICGHGEVNKVGVVLGLATESGYHHSRDKLDFQSKERKDVHYIGRPSNPKKICKCCALLSLLGTWYASFIFNITDREVIAIPIPKDKISGSNLQEIFSLQHQIRRNWINKEIPEIIIPLILLSKVPSSSDILKGFDLFIGLLSRQQGYHVDGLYLISINNYLDFIRANPYNIASIDIMLRREAYGALQELNKVIYYQVVTSLLNFSRLYVKETSSNNFTNLLYPETSKYILREVAMINSKIIENPALGSLARTLRYFIRERKYSYADDIRNARKESKIFEETIAKMLREGELRRIQQEQDKKTGKTIKNWIHLPNEEDIKEVFRLASADFDKTKTALVILAFSFPVKAEEGVNETIEEVQNA